MSVASLPLSASDAPAAGRATLADLKPGERARVASIAGQPALAQRLMEMGLTPGIEVTLVRLAPLGDPMELRVRGYALSLRREDARRVLVAPA